MWWGLKPARCSLRSWEITWPHNLGYLPSSGRETEHVGGGSFVSHFPRSVRERVSSFCHPVSPGAVQFLDPSPSVSSRLVLSTSCSSLLPPRLPWSSPPRPETSNPATHFSQVFTFRKDSFHATSRRETVFLTTQLESGTAKRIGICFTLPCHHHHSRLIDEQAVVWKHYDSYESITCPAARPCGLLLCDRTHLFQSGPAAALWSYFSAV